MNGKSTDGDRQIPAPADTKSRKGVGGDGKLVTPPRLIAVLMAVSTLVPLAQPAFGAELSASAQAGSTVRTASVGTNALPGPVGDQPTADPLNEARKEKRARAAREARERRLEAKRKRELAAKRAAAKRAAAKPDFVRPTVGTLTSGFGARWGTQHSGVDIANSLGTPIVSVADGTVVEAGPASGFGLWVKIQHDDGSVTVYGHMYEYSVSAGQRVEAGEQIATIGSNGQSTGPHLHFEVWQGGSAKIDPSSWLASRGVQI